MSKCDFNKVALQLYEITLRHGWSPVNLLHIFKTPFLMNTSGWLLLNHHQQIDSDCEKCLKGLKIEVFPLNLIDICIVYLFISCYRIKEIVEI